MTGKNIRKAQIWRAKYFAALFADAILRRTERRGNSKAHVCRPLGEPFWKLAWCHRRISVPSLAVLSTRGARESSKIKSRGFRPFASRKAADRLLLRTWHVYSRTTTPGEQRPAFKCYRYPIDRVYRLCHFDKRVTFSKPRRDTSVCFD